MLCGDPKSLIECSYYSNPQEILAITFQGLPCVSFVKVYQCMCVCFFPFGLEGEMWDLIVFIPDHCLSIYFENVPCFFEVRSFTSWYAHLLLVLFRQVSISSH